MKSYEHYQEAERLLALADERVSHEWLRQSGEQKADIIAAAQVHAALAQTAALVHRFAPTSDETRDGWSRVLGEG